MWVAVIGRRVVGLRSYLRWRFLQVDSRVVRAARAVDTATHPDYRRRGIFRQLTLASLEGLRKADVAFVFNNPNKNSLAGYLSMGWRKVCRLPVLARPLRLASLPRIVRACGHSPHVWSRTSKVGRPAAEVLRDRDGLASLLSHSPLSRGMTTHRTPDYLCWRYGFPALRYRAIVMHNDLRHGILILRERTRGPITELIVAELLLPDVHQRGDAVRFLNEHVARHSNADIAVRLAGDGFPREGFIPIPGLGPTLVWRGILDNRPLRPDSLCLTLGDIELL